MRSHECMHSPSSTASSMHACMPPAAAGGPCGVTWRRDGDTLRSRALPCTHTQATAHTCACRPPMRACTHTHARPRTHVHRSSQQISPSFPLSSCPSLSTAPRQPRSDPRSMQHGGWRGKPVHCPPPRPIESSYPSLARSLARTHPARCWSGSAGWARSSWAPPRPPSRSAWACASCVGWCGGDVRQLGDDESGEPLLLLLHWIALRTVPRPPCAWPRCRPAAAGEAGHPAQPSCPGTRPGCPAQRGVCWCWWCCCCCCWQQPAAASSAHAW